DGRSRRLPHALSPLRGSPVAHRAEGDRRGEEGERGSQGLTDEKPPPLDAELVAEFVLMAHGDLGVVKQLVEQEPALVNAAWDWGGGDWETGLGAAAHVGRRDIAEYLLGHGARKDVFAAARARGAARGGAHADRH